MKVFIKGLNVCPHRRQNLAHHKCFIENNGHNVVFDPQESEIILIWTCGFRQDVIDNSINELNRYKDKYTATIVALGCLPDIDRDQLESNFKGLIVPWKEEESFFESYFNSPKGSFAASSPIFHENALCEDAAEYRSLHPDKDALFADQFFKLNISWGCPYNCTYCTEKLAFPSFKSVNEDDLIEACRRPVEQEGQRRFILIADCLGEYGRDIDSSLPQLLKRLHAEYPQTTYALQNLHPKNFLDFFVDMKQFLEDGWIAHLNLPIQSASDKILTAMNRQYSKNDLDKIFYFLKQINFTEFDTHIIVGFPGETDQDFTETLQFLETYKPKYALVSKYYDAPNAQASKIMDKVPDGTVIKRLEIIESVMKKMGILYNIDGADLMKDRMDRINKMTYSLHSQS